MIKRLVVVAALCLSFSFVGHAAADPIQLDVKTQLVEKRALMAAKAGLIAYINASGWGQVVEVGEDNAIWLLNYHRRVDHERGRVVVSMTIELHRPTMGSRKAAYLLSREQVEVSYSTLDAAVERGPMVDAVFAQLAQAYGYRNLAIMVGKATVAGSIHSTALNRVVDAIVDEATEDDQAPNQDEIYEGLVVGAELFQRMERMVTTYYRYPQ